MTSTVKYGHRSHDWHMTSKTVTGLKVCFGNLISDVARWVGLSVGICNKGGLVQPLNSTGRVHVYVCMRAWKGRKRSLQQM